MSRTATFSWILDSGGAGRGAWQGGVIHQFMQWARLNGCYPTVSMGASAGGYAAADVATGTHATVMKGWTRWGAGAIPPPRRVQSSERSFWGLGRFRLHLMASIRYVMAEGETSAVFDQAHSRKLLVFTSRIRRRDGREMGSSDARLLFLRAATRKLPRPLKYLPQAYVEEPVVFATPLPPELNSEHVRPLTRRNYHSALLASCLVPLAMGSPLQAGQLAPDPDVDSSRSFPGDRRAVFIDGGYTMKMPMAIFEENRAFQRLARWAAADKTIIFCCDPQGILWETSFRLRALNQYPSVAKAIAGNRMLVVLPDHPIEAGFLCCDNDVAMRTFRRGQEQADRLLRSDAVRRFLERGEIGSCTTP
jgi:predicted acylesterase/phospholipase RssA